MKKLSFLLSFVLLLSLVSPAWASANVMNWDKYDYKYGKGVNNPLYTANDALIIEDMEEVRNSVYGKVYNYDLVRIDQNKKVETKSFENGLNRFVEHNGKSYSLFYDYVTDKLEVYDEYFKSVKTIPFNQPLDGYVSFYQYENYISYVMYDRSDIPQVIVIDLNTFQIVDNVKTPAADAEYSIEEDQTIVVYDQLGHIIKKFEWSEDLGYADFNVVNGKIYAIGYGLESDLFIKLTPDGKIIDKEKLNTSNYTCSYDVAVVGDRIFYTCHDMDSMDHSTYTFSYNAKSDKLDQTPIPNVVIHPVDDETYIQQTKIPHFLNGPAIVKSVDGETKVTIQDEISEYSKVSGKYILSEYPNKIIDIETGKLIGQIVENPDEDSEYVFIDNNKIYQKTVTYDEDYNEKASSGTLYIINPDNIEKPKPDPNAHPADKQWTITFSMDVDAKMVNASTVYVTDENGNKLNQQVTTEGKKVIVHAPNDLYKSGKYVLHVENSVKSITGEVLKAGETKAFSIQ